MNRKLLELIEYYIENRCTPEQLGELTLLLRTVPNAMSTFRDRVAMDAHLRAEAAFEVGRRPLKNSVQEQVKWLSMTADYRASTWQRLRMLEKSMEEHSEPEEQEERRVRRIQRKTSRRRTFPVVLSLLALAALTLYTYHILETRSPVLRTDLMLAVDAVHGKVIYEPRSKRARLLHRGRVLSPGDRLTTFTNAGVELHYRDESLLKIHSSSNIRIVDHILAKQIGITQGALSGKINCQPQINPFKLITPYARTLIDQGRFFITVSSNFCRLDIKQGRAEIFLSQSQRPRILRAGRALLFKDASTTNILMLGHTTLRPLSPRYGGLLYHDAVNWYDQRRAFLLDHRPRKAGELVERVNVETLLKNIRCPSNQPMLHVSACTPPGAVANDARCLRLVNTHAEIAWFGFGLALPLSDIDTGAVVSFDWYFEPVAGTNMPFFYYTLDAEPHRMLLDFQPFTLPELEPALQSASTSENRIQIMRPQAWIRIRDEIIRIGEDWRGTPIYEHRIVFSNHQEQVFMNGFKKGTPKTLALKIASLTGYIRDLTIESFD